MAFGDIGGIVTELAITCRTTQSGVVSIRKGDALALVGPYTVTNATAAGDPVFGEAMADINVNDEAVPVKVRGVLAFNYSGDTPPTVDGATGIVASATPGKVQPPSSGLGHGINLAVDTAAKIVHVLL